MLGLLRSYLKRAGRLCKGLISRMLWGGFKVDSESVWVGLELICARCAARLLGCFRDVVAQGLGWFGWLGARPTTTKNCTTTSLKQPKCYCENCAAHLAQISSKPTQTDSESTLNPPNSILDISPLKSLNEPQTSPRLAQHSPETSPGSNSLPPNQWVLGMLGMRPPS